MEQEEEIILVIFVKVQIAIALVFFLFGSGFLVICLFGIFCSEAHYYCPCQCGYTRKTKFPFKIFLPPKCLNIVFTSISFAKEKLDVENLLFIAH